MDVRPSTPTRTSGTAERNKEGLRFSSSNVAQCEDRTLTIGIDGWENTKIRYWSKLNFLANFRRKLGAIYIRLLSL